MNPFSPSSLLGVIFFRYLLLNYFPSLYRKIDLVVDAKSRGKFIIVVDLIEIVRDIKAKIRLVTFIELGDQRLFFKKKELEDNARVGLCGLYNNCCIHLVRSDQTLPEPTLEADQMVRINLF